MRLFISSIFFGDDDIAQESYENINYSNDYNVNSNKIFVRLWTFVEGVWVYNDYQYSVLLQTNITNSSALPSKISISINSTKNEIAINQDDYAEFKWEIPENIKVCFISGIGIVKRSSSLNIKIVKEGDYMMTCPLDNSSENISELIKVKFK